MHHGYDYFNVLRVWWFDETMWCGGAQPPPSPPEPHLSLPKYSILPTFQVWGTLLAAGVSCLCHHAGQCTANTTTFFNVCPVRISSVLLIRLPVFRLDDLRSTMPVSHQGPT